MPDYSLLIGAEAFWGKAAADIAGARRRVLIQAMTFEGDAAGQAVATAIGLASAADRRVLIDDYSRHVTNDTLLPLMPYQATGLRREARATRAMFSALAAGGTGVRVTNPVGYQPLRFPLRNHKKLLVIDDVAYIGGINFSDHNFAWHDLMVRIDDPQASDFLAEDFDRDWAGRPASAAGRFGGLELVTLDGTSNSAALAPVLAMFAGARRSIEMIGAYPTAPFTDALARAAERGCAVTLYSPSENNKPLLRDYLFALAGSSRIALRLLPAMTHVKAALVDGRTLLLGSVNFNVASYRTNGDLLAISRDKALVKAFEQELFAPARAQAGPPVRPRVAGWRRLRARGTLALTDLVLARLRHGPVRSIDWADVV